MIIVQNEKDAIKTCKEFLKNHKNNMFNIQVGEFQKLYGSIEFLIEKMEKEKN